MKPLGIIIFIGWLIQQLLRKKSIYFPKVLKFAFLYVIWATLSLIWSYRPLTGSVFTLVTLAGLFFIIPQIITNLKNLNKIIIFTVFTSLISVFIAIIKFIQNPNLRMVLLGKSAGYYSISISLAVFYFLFQRFMAHL